MLRFITLFCLLLGLASSVSADVMVLHGTGASTGLSLDATVDFQVDSTTQLTVTLTNITSTAGTSARITNFGLQLQTSGVTAVVDSGSDSLPWTTQKNHTLAGSGSDTFNWLFSHTGGGLPGLKYNDQLIIHFTASTPLFNPLDLSSWTPTSKNELLSAVKFQSVGPDCTDSGVASSMGATTATIPEPSVLALIGLGILLMLPRRNKHRVQA